MIITGFEKVSLVDYNGFIACTLFCGGCNFQCPFCHNGHLVNDYKSFTQYQEEEILSYLTKRKGIIEAVVLSGGEPTLQKDIDCFAGKLRSLGLRIKLDTNGSHPEVLKRLVKQNLIDYVAMDIKCSPNGYPSITGLSSFPHEVMQSADFLINGNVDYEFRTTLVNGYFSDKDIMEMCNWLKGAKKIYLQRFIDRESCIKHGLQEIPYNTALAYQKIFIDNNIDCALRNYD